MTVLQLVLGAEARVNETGFFAQRNSADDRRITVSLASQ
jgi:hypothetical protein